MMIVASMTVVVVTIAVLQARLGATPNGGIKFPHH
jgi:hypothetical protein